MEPVSPLVVAAGAAAQDARDSRAAMVTVYLVAGDAGDGNEHDLVVWERPRLVAPGRPDLLLRDVRGVARELAALARASLRRRGQVPGRRGRGERGQGRASTWPSWRGGTASSPRSWRPGSITWASAPAATAVKIDTPLTAKIDNVVGL